jgi:catecholate siderophore receptor
MCIALSAAAVAHADAVSDTKTMPRISVEAIEPDVYRAPESRTATKTDTALRDVPQSISVVTRALIQDQSMQGLADVARYVPGAGMAQGEGNRDTIILRGSSSTADFFVDGVRDDVEYFRDLYNVDRVEALKGPNAMIFGRGGAGGVINRVTRQADWERVREVSLQGGSWNSLRGTFDVGDSVNETVALRLTGMYQNSESYRDGYDLEGFGVNPTVAFRLGDDTEPARLLRVLRLRPHRRSRHSLAQWPPLRGRLLDVLRRSGCQHHQCDGEHRHSSARPLIQ